MSWLQLEFDTNQTYAEILSELLEQFGAISVSLSAASDEPVFDAVMGLQIFYIQQHVYLPYRCLRRGLATSS